jgi:hypothetical protein
MYLFMQKLKRRIIIESQTELKCLEFIVAEDWMAEVTAVDVRFPWDVTESDLSLA